MNKQKKYEEGITLISLVITIIVLLIIAGISIAMISGNNGILSKTGEAIVKQQLGTAQDKCVLIASNKLAEYYYDTYVNVSEDKNEGYNSRKLDNAIVEAIIKDDKNVKELKDLGVTPKGNEEETDGARTKFTLTYSDGTNITGTVDNGKIIWDEDVKGGIAPGDEENPIQLFDSKLSGVGYYADIEGDGIVDGIIYADLTKGNTGSGQWYEEDGKYTIPIIEGTKNYYISKKDYEGPFGTKDVLSPVSTSEGKERFYIMELEDIDGKQNGTYYDWYSSARGVMNDYDKTTSGKFGAGRTNTNTMISRWNAGRLWKTR